MTTEHLTLLRESINQTVEFEALDGTRFLATPLFVYEGEDNPDVFFLPVDRTTGKAAEAGQSILLEDIESVRRVSEA